LTELAHHLPERLDGVAGAGWGSRHLHGGPVGVAVPVPPKASSTIRRIRSAVPVQAGGM
jgi:hypothetical protein